MAYQQRWLELPPISDTAPSRLMVFLHGAGSSPEAFAPVAIAWQLKFPGATSIVLGGLRPATSGGLDWFDGSGVAIDRVERVDEAAQRVNDQIDAIQADAGFDPDGTMLVGFSQGATVALECLRRPAPCAAMVVSYAGRLASPIGRRESIPADVHLLHGALDSVVPVVHARQALRGLSAAGARVTLDVIGDDAHTIGQEMINIGTARAMRTVFRGRRRASRADGPPLMH